MDLGAYANIDSLEELASKNHIAVPRLRGYRLMKDEEPVDIDKIVTEGTVTIAENLISSDFRINSNTSEWSARTDRAIKKYTDGDAIHWDKLHGKKRKALKYELKSYEKRVRSQFDVFNKYCGREDVLNIHARIGGYNWNYYNGDNLKKEPWFLDKVDDSFDGTYCDIYAKIDVTQSYQEKEQKEFKK